MPNRAGLKRVTKTVRGRKGAVKRTYWVRAKDAAKGAGRFVKRNAGKIVAGAALAGGAALALKHRGHIAAAARLAHAAHVAGRERAVKFNKAAQQSQWNRKDTLRHTLKGYRQGVEKSDLGKRYKEWRGHPIKDAQGNTHGRVKRID